MRRILPFLFAMIATGPALAQSVTVPDLLARLTRLETEMTELRARLDALAPVAAVSPAANPVAASPALTAANEPQPLSTVALQAATAAIQPGAMVALRPAPAHPPTTLKAGELPPIKDGSYAGFLWTGGPVNLFDASKYGGRYKGLTAADFGGLLAVKEAGVHQISAEVTVTAIPGRNYTSRCILAGWVEDTPVLAVVAKIEAHNWTTPKLKGTALLTGPVNFSQPGNYALRLYVGCPATEAPTLEGAEVAPFIQGPRDMSPRPITPQDLQHRPS